MAVPNNYSGTAATEFDCASTLLFDAARECAFCSEFLFVTHSRTVDRTSGSRAPTRELEG
jgi:hypothetical protein